MIKLSPFSLAFITVAVFAASVLKAETNMPFEQAMLRIGGDDNIVGLAVAVVRNGEVSFLNTYGVREAGQPEKVTPQTIFRIASLSKAFAATVAVQLAHEGELSLANPITKFNRDFQLQDPAQANAVTLTDVLSHRLSLPPFAYDNLLEAGQAPAKILREMKKVTPVCNVGGCYAYQNVGFNMITSAIESSTQQSYADVVSDRLFKPLGMSNASLGKANLLTSENWARSHRRGKNRDWEVREVKQPYYSVPAAGGINASVIDMTKWLAAQMGHASEVLSAKTLSTLQSPIVKTHAELRRNRSMKNLTDAQYGLGWRIFKYAGQTVVNHSGSVEGYIAQIAFLPKQDVGIVILSNSRSRQFWKILPLFLDYELELENELLVQDRIG